MSSKQTRPNTAQYIGEAIGNLINLAWESAFLALGVWWFLPTTSLSYNPAYITLWWYAAWFLAAVNFITQVISVKVVRK